MSRDARADMEARLRAAGEKVRVLEDRDGGLHTVTDFEIEACKLTPKDMAEAMRLAARDRAEAGKAPCSCPSPDPFGFTVDGVQCCLTCGGRLHGGSLTGRVSCANPPEATPPRTVAKHKSFAARYGSTTFGKDFPGGGHGR